MAYRDILAPVIALAEDEAALATAADVAAMFDAKATALIVAVHAGSAYVDHEQPFSAVLQDIARGPKSLAAKQRNEIIAWIGEASHRFDIRDLTIENAVHQDEVVAHARLADLIVMARGAGHDRARQAMIEDILFKSGRPMLLVPERPVRRRDWQTIVIGWNAKAEAVHAIRAAMPMLQAAKRVVIATVDATPRPSGHSKKPGRELAEHLARHDVRADVHNLDGLGRSEGRALLDEAIALNADMLVMGAYGHSRAREFIFGGVTRELLKGATVPLLVAH